MRQRAIRVVMLCLSGLAVLCWGVMFLAGTDVWHDVGRPDFWHLAGPPYHDLRAFTIAFYVLFALLASHLIVAAIDLSVWRRSHSRR